MADIDFSKVEQLFDKTILEYDVKSLLYMADIVAHVGDRVDPFDSYRKDPKVQLRLLEFDLRHLKKYDSSLFKSLNLPAKELKKYFNKPDSITEEDLKKIILIREKLKDLKSDLRKRLIEQISAEEYIENERLKSINQRFNIRDHWLPLH